MKAEEAHVGMKVIRTGNPMDNHPLGQIATIKRVQANGQWLEFEEFGQWWMIQHWSPLEEVVAPVPRRDINKDLHVGDRVVAIKRFIRLNGELMKEGDVAVVNEIISRRNNIIIFRVVGGDVSCASYCWELEENYLADKAPVEQKEGPMTRFVFCSRGGKYYMKGSFNSLEGAIEHAKHLRHVHGTNDIYPFVIVED